jgi:hypothetical protein
VTENAQKKRGGFDRAVLTEKSEANPSAGAASLISETALNDRLFLLSMGTIEVSPVDKPENTGGNSKQVTKKKTRPTNNRKHIVYDDYFTHKDERYRVNPEKSGLYVEILKPLIKQFEIACQKWGRVFTLRFDLHQHVSTGDNKRITAFRKRLFAKLKYQYSFKEIGFCWVRERERAKAQHYHFVLFLDGSLVRHSSKINRMIKDAWDDGTGTYHVPVIKRPYYFGSGEQIRTDVIYRCSYLAKPRGKGYRDKQAKDYQCSRMKLKKSKQQNKAIPTRYQQK